jgi:hypothetical protein
MTQVESGVVAGRRCHLRKPVRDQAGRTRFGQSPQILKEINNLGRQMYLVRFEDGATTFLFPDEVEIE